MDRSSSSNHVQEKILFLNLFSLYVIGYSLHSEFSTHSLCAGKIPFTKCTIPRNVNSLFAFSKSTPLCSSALAANIQNAQIYGLKLQMPEFRTIIFNEYRRLREIRKYMIFIWINIIYLYIFFNRIF